MRCQSCGKDIPINSNFCEYCGAKVKKKKSRWITIAVLFAIILSSIGIIVFIQQQTRELPTTYQNNNMFEIEMDSLLTNNYVDLGLPSGILWKKYNEEGLYMFEDAENDFGESLPTKESWEELKENCEWKWNGSGYNIKGPNGNNLVLSDGVFQQQNGLTSHYGFWTSSLDDSGDVWGLSCGPDSVTMFRYSGAPRFVRLVFKSHKERSGSRSHQQSTKSREKIKKAEKRITSKYIDIGLPSGTLWFSVNEKGYYDFYSAVHKFGNNLPTRDKWIELKDKCQWVWKDIGYEITGPNGNSIFLPASGCSYEDNVFEVGSYGSYWSSTMIYDDNACGICFRSNYVHLTNGTPKTGCSVRLVKD